MPHPYVRVCHREMRAGHIDRPATLLRNLLPDMEQTYLLRMAAWAAAKRATGTRNGEQLT